MKCISSLICFAVLSLSHTGQSEELVIRSFLESHCLKCHGGEKTKGDVDFSKIKTVADADRHPELWETVSLVLEDREMPPEKEPQPTEAELAAFDDWYQNNYLGEVESKPAVFQPRRLSGPEYRNTLRSLFGFDLEVSIIEAEQTVVEKSLVLKLLPTDPPGASGFINDTRGARLSTTIWDQYSYLADFGLEQLFLDQTKMTFDEAEGLIREFVPRAFRRPVPEEKIAVILKNIGGHPDSDRIAALKSELKTVLMSPGFLYRGFLMDTSGEKERQAVDDYELAERISYFLWEDMPDEELLNVAKNGELKNPDVLTRQVDRMLASPKSRTLAESFGTQWLLLDQIKHERNDPPQLHALKSQPLDFLDYLFTEDRPVIELIDSEVTFANAMTAGFYGGDRKQLKRFNKPRGIEVMVMPNQKITLVESRNDRGGIITMPGVLGMNRGPILRGTWLLRQVLGEHLGEPPPDVPPIKASPKGQNLSFRERFEQHRADKSCALCHDKIDPLGFALEGYDNKGGVIGKNQSRKKKNAQAENAGGIDTSGQLPNGQTFKNFAELKAILITSEKEKIIRNAVEQMLSYALCRKLERFDRPTVDALTAQIVETNGTWRDLIHGIANSVPFREVRIVPASTTP